MATTCNDLRKVYKSDLKAFYLNDNLKLRQKFWQKF